MFVYVYYEDRKEYIIKDNGGKNIKKSEKPLTLASRLLMP